MNKKKSIISYGKAKESILNAIATVYPHGFENFLSTIKGVNGQEEKALYLEMPDAIYLVKFSSKDLKSVFSYSDGFSSSFDDDDDDNDNEDIDIDPDSISDDSENSFDA